MGRSSGVRPTASDREQEGLQQRTPADEAHGDDEGDHHDSEAQDEQAEVAGAHFEGGGGRPSRQREPDLSDGRV